MSELNTLYGRISVPDWPDDLIVQALHVFGEWAPIEQRLFAGLLRKHDRVWDGGAFLGTFGLGAAQMAAASGRRPEFLLAIEPGNVASVHLGRNLEWNSPCSWNVAPYAISTEEQMLSPAVETAENHGALAYVPASDAKTGSSDDSSSGPGASDAAPEVQGLPLWRLRETYGDYDCLKLDVEGMEFDALRSDFAYLKARKPTVWVECNESTASLKILEALLALEYKPLYIAFPAFRPDNFNGSSEKFFPLAYEASLVGASTEGIEALRSIRDIPELIIAPVQDAWELRQAMWLTPRWAKEAWVSLSRPELIALLGRTTREEDLAQFLNP